MPQAASGSRREPESDPPPASTTTSPPPVPFVPPGELEPEPLLPELLPLPPLPALPPLPVRGVAVEELLHAHTGAARGAATMAALKRSLW